MKATIDPNLYTQIGLDSGSLTILGSIVHSLGDPGEYRVALHHGESVEGVCFITADKNSPAAQVTVDLAALSAAPEQAGGNTPGDKGCCCGGGEQGAGGQSFTVNPKGYVLFRVSGGGGGYYVHVRRIDEDPKDKGYDSRAIGGGDLFSGRAAAGDLLRLQYADQGQGHTRGLLSENWRQGLCSAESGSRRMRDRFVRAREATDTTRAGSHL